MKTSSGGLEELNFPDLNFFPTPPLRINKIMIKRFFASLDADKTTRSLVRTELLLWETFGDKTLYCGVIFAWRVTCRITRYEIFHTVWSQRFIGSKSYYVLYVDSFIVGDFVSIHTYIASRIRTCRRRLMVTIRLYREKKKKRCSHHYYIYIQTSAAITVICTAVEKCLLPVHAPRVSREHLGSQFTGN